MIFHPTMTPTKPTSSASGEISSTGRHHVLDTQRGDAAGIDSRPTTVSATPRLDASGGTQLAGRQRTCDAQRRAAAGIDPRLATELPVPNKDAPDGTTSPTTKSDSMPTGDASRGIEDEPSGHATSQDTEPRMRSLHDPALVFAADILDDLEAVRTANKNRLRQMTRSVEDSDGQIRGLGYDETHPDVARLAAMVDTLAKLEHDAELNLARILRRHPLGSWVKAFKGVGPKQAPRLLAAIGDPYIRPEWTKADGTVVPEGPRTVSALWAYCGLHVLPVGQSGPDIHASRADRDQLPTDQSTPENQVSGIGGDQGGDPGQDANASRGGFAGVAPKRARNQQSNWSETARKRVWLVADACRKQLVKPCTGITEDTYAVHVDDCQCSPYRVIYDVGRLKYAHAKHETPCVRCGPKGKPAEVGSPLSAAHQDARARRLVMKEILKDLWRQAKSIHEQP